MTREEYKYKIQRPPNQTRCFTRGMSDGDRSPDGLLNALCELIPQTPTPSRTTRHRERDGDRRSRSPHRRSQSPKTSICTSRARRNRKYQATENLRRQSSRKPTRTARSSRSSSGRRYRRTDSTDTTSESTSGSSETEWTDTDYSSGDSPPEMATHLGRNLRDAGLRPGTSKEHQTHRSSLARRVQGRLHLGKKTQRVPVRGL
nr:ORF3 [Epsilontorquevirus sp.]